MRTTIAFEPDVAAEIERLRRERSAGVSEVVNELIRQGLAAPRARRRFEQEATGMGAKIDVANIGEVLEVAEGSTRR